MTIGRALAGLLALVLSSYGCSTPTKERRPPPSSTCEDEGAPCACDGDRAAATLRCEGTRSVCDCTDTPPEADDDDESDETTSDAPSPDDVARPARDASGPGSVRDASVRSDAGVRTDAGVRNDAGSASGPDAGRSDAGSTSGPEDGDPSRPQVAIPGIPCGSPKIGFGSAPPSVKIGGRDVVVAYPCAREGARVTFFLFLHGTLQESIKVSFTMNAFAIHKLVDSHNVIVVTPKAIGTQWGNGDEGQDAPHLAQVVDWVYETFGTKFDIRSMWAQGGSWGAAYLSSRFACDARYESRLKGIQLIVGGGCPRCSDRLSCIVGQQELQLGNGMQLSAAAREQAADRAAIAPYAMQHGCGPKRGPEPVGKNQYWSWPGCDPRFVHSYYLAPGEHADTWDAAAVLKMTEEMKSTER